MTGQRTVPNIFVAQQHIGGCDDLTDLARGHKQFLTRLRDAGALQEDSADDKD